MLAPFVSRERNAWLMLLVRTYYIDTSRPRPRYPRCRQVTLKRNHKQADSHPQSREECNAKRNPHLTSPLRHSLNEEAHTQHAEPQRQNIEQRRNPRKQFLTLSNPLWNTLIVSAET
jgi:hypothetical protein